MSAIIMCCVVFLMNYIVINTFLLLILQVVGGCLIYMAISVIIKNENLFYVFKLAKSILKGSQNEQN